MPSRPLPWTSLPSKQYGTSPNSPGLLSTCSAEVTDALHQASEMVPVKLLWSSHTPDSACSFPRDAGRVPESWLLLRFRHCRWGREPIWYGTVPCSRKCKVSLILSACQVCCAFVIIQQNKGKWLGPESCRTMIFCQVTVASDCLACLKRE